MLFLFAFLAQLVILFFLSRLLTRSLASLFYSITRSQTATINLLSFLFLPGVIIHELAHLLVASALFVPVGEVEFFPKISQDGVKLGSVAIGKTDLFRRALIGIAPILVGTALLLLALFYLTQDTFLFEVAPYLRIAIALYVVFEIGNTMFSSRQDIEGAVELFLAIVLIAFILSFTQFRQHFFSIELTLSQNLLDQLRRIDALLLVPLAIDIAVYALTRLLVRSR